MTLSTPLFLRDWMNDGRWKATHAGRTLLMTLSHCSSISGPSLFGSGVSDHGCQHDEGGPTSTADSGWPRERGYLDCRAHNLGFAHCVCGHSGDQSRCGRVLVIGRRWMDVDTSSALPRPMATGPCPAGVRDGKVEMGRAHRLATPVPGRVVLWEAAPEHQVSEL